MIDAWGAAKQCLQRKEEGLGQLSCEMAKIGPKDAKSSQTWSKVTKSSQSKQPKPKVVKRPPKAAQKQPKAVKNCQRWPKAAFGRGRGEGTPPPWGAVSLAQVATSQGHVGVDREHISPKGVHPLGWGPRIAGGPNPGRSALLTDSA